MVDAGAMLELLLGRPQAVTALESEAAGHEHEPLHAPELIDLETANALRRTLLRGVIAEHQAASAVVDLANARLVRYPHAPLLSRVWSLRHNLTAYDASYLALAELLDESVLLTTDGGLAMVATQHLGASRVRAIA